MELSLIKPEEFKKVPWKNGRGLTNELAVHFSDGDDRFIWRISIAGVTENGIFSEFSGYDRTLLMLTGNGIRLVHSDGTESKIGNINDIAHFSGDLKTNAVLTDGPITDFNVMTLRGKCKSVTGILFKGHEFETSSGVICIYARNGSAEITIEDMSDGSVRVPCGHLLKIEKHTKARVSVTKGEIIAVRIEYL